MWRALNLLNLYGCQAVWHKLKKRAKNNKNVFLALFGLLLLQIDVREQACYYRNIFMASFYTNATLCGAKYTDTTNTVITEELVYRPKSSLKNWVDKQSWLFWYWNLFTFGLAQISSRNKTFLFVKSQDGQPNFLASVWFQLKQTTYWKNWN